MAERRRALIVGPYKAHNFGDDLVGGILAKHLQQHGYDVSIPRLSEANSAWLGSYNFNKKSRRKNAEVLLRTTDTGVIEKLSKRFAQIAAMAQ